MKLLESNRHSLDRSRIKHVLLAMNPSEYLAKYCRVSPRRYTLYRRIFEKYQNQHGEMDKEVRQTNCSRSILEKSLDIS